MTITHTLTFSTEAAAADFVRELEMRSDWKSLKYDRDGSAIRLSDRTFTLVQDTINDWVASQK